MNNNECTECYKNYTLVDSNCYEICNFYYYFDEFNERHYTQKNECPINNPFESENYECINECNATN